MKIVGHDMQFSVSLEYRNPSIRVKTIALKYVYLTRMNLLSEIQSLHIYSQLEQ